MDGKSAFVPSTAGLSSVMATEESDLNGQERTWPFGACVLVERRQITNKETNIKIL